MNFSITQCLSALRYGNYPYNSIILFTASSYVVAGQSILYFNLGAKPQPENWQMIHDIHTTAMNDAVEPWPVFQSDLGLKKFIIRDSWYWEVGLSLRHTRLVREFQSEDFNSLQPDPAIEEALKNGGIKRSEELYYTGVKSGIGFLFSSYNSRHAFLTTMGLQAHAPTYSRLVSTIGNSENTQPLYRGRDFEFGIYYGAYFKPTYEFALSKKRSNPWRFSVYAEGDLLIHHHSKINPKFLWGGGLGISYRLKP